MAIYVASGAVLIILAYLLVMYNSFVKLRNSVKEAFSTMDVYLKMRWDLIPNLVEVVKGYVNHEREVLERVTELRSMPYDNLSYSDKININEKLSAGLGKLMVVVENYPDLKASRHFTELGLQLSKVEDDISNARKYYNAVVKNMNNHVEMFPGNVVAKLFGFSQYPFFEAQAGERDNVKVGL